MMTSNQEYLANFRELLTRVYGGSVPEKIDSKQLQVDRENDVKNIVSAISDMRYTKKKFDCQLETYQAQFEKKMASFDVLKAKIPTLQECVDKLKKKTHAREILMKPVLEFLTNVGLKIEITNVSDEDGDDCDLNLFLSQVQPQPERVLNVQLSYTTSYIRVNSSDPAETMDKLVEIAEATNGKLVKGKINFLYFLHEARTAFTEYLEEK